MNRNSRAARMAALVLACSLALSACGGAASSPTPTPPGTPPATPAPTRTLTPTITPTPTPTAVILSRLGTPLPESRAAIALENTAQLVEIARWGKGLPAAAAVSPDGERVAVAASSGLHLYAAADFQPLRSIELDIPLTALAFSADSQRTAAGDALGIVRVWDAEGNLLHELSGGGFPVLALAFSADGSRLAASGWEGAIRVWHAPDGELALSLPGQRRAATALAFSPDGTTLYSWSNREPIQRWPLSGGGEAAQWYIGQTNDGRTGSSAVFSTDGSVFAAAQDWRVRVFNTADGTTRSQLQPVSAPIAAVALSADGTLAASSDQKGVKVWKTADGSLLHQTPAAPAAFLAFSADSQSLLLQGSVASLEIWRFTGDQGFQPATPAEYLPAHPSGAGFLPKSGALAIPLLNGGVFSLLPQSALQPLRVAPLSVRLDSATLSPDGTLLAGGTGNLQVQVFEIESGETRYTLRGFGGNVGKLAFSPDSTLLATGSGDRRLRVYRMADGTPVHLSELRGAIAQLGFSPDGRLLAVVSENLIQLWRASDWTLLANYTGSRFAFSAQGDLLAVANSPGRGQIITLHRLSKRTEAASFEAQGASLAFSPDGSLLAVAGQELTLWDTARGVQVAALPLTRPFGQAAFSPAGDMLALTSWDGVVTLWGLP